MIYGVENAGKAGVRQDHRQDATSGTRKCMRDVVALLNGRGGRWLLLFALLRHRECPRKNGLGVWEGRLQYEDEEECDLGRVEGTRRRGVTIERIQEKKGAIMIRLEEWEKRS